MYARAYKYFFFKSHLKKKFLVAVIHFFEKLSRKFKIYIYLCLSHMVQINLFFLYDQSTIRLGENKKINLSISLIFPQYTQVFNFM